MSPLNRLAFFFHLHLKLLSHLILLLVDLGQLFLLTLEALNVEAELLCLLDSARTLFRVLFVHPFEFLLHPKNSLGINAI